MTLQERARIAVACGFYNPKSRGYYRLKDLSLDVDDFERTLSAFNGPHV